MPFGTIKKFGELDDDEELNEKQDPYIMLKLSNLIHDFKEILGLFEFIKAMCPICRKGNVYLIKHHVSYFPERTIFICRCCHVKIHSEPHFFPELTPKEGDAVKFYERGKKENE